MRSDDFKLYEIRSSSLDQQTSDAVTAGQAIGALADEYDFIGQHAFTTASFRLGGETAPQPTFSRIVRAEGDVPADAKPNTYYVKQVKEVVPLGAAVCTHVESTPKEAINTMERHAIRRATTVSRSCRPRARAARAVQLARAPRVQSCC